jgi:hypothetical protein
MYNLLIYYKDHFLLNITKNIWRIRKKWTAGNF